VYRNYNELNDEYLVVDWVVSSIDERIRGKRTRYRRRKRRRRRKCRGEGEGEERKWRRSNVAPVSRSSSLAVS